MTGLRWSRRTTTTIAEELARLGIAVSPNTVARLLHNMGYSLRVTPLMARDITDRLKVTCLVSALIGVWLTGTPDLWFRRPFRTKS